MKTKNTIENTEATSKTNPIATFAEMLGGQAGAIERQEARGQRELIQSEVLPTEGLGLVAETLGVKIGSQVDGDPIFTHVELPKGWKKAATNHSMWSKLIDDRGRERAAIFYKAAFYDRSAHIRLTNRYRVGQDYSDATSDARLILFTVEDCGSVVFRCQPQPDPTYGPDGNTVDRAHYNTASAERNSIEKQQELECQSWLAANRPNHADPVKQWED